MNYVKINGVPFDATVAISDLEESFEVLDGENAGRSTFSGIMIRDIIGTFIGHKVTFFNNDNTEFDALWDYLKTHSIDDSVSLEASDGQSSITYDAYYTSGKRTLKSVVDGVNYWDELEVNFVPMEPQVTP